MKHILARTAAEGIEADWSESNDGFCQRFLRQCVQQAYGSEYNAYMRASAKASGLAFLNSPYGFRPSELKAHGGLKVGDILYKTVGSGGFGHVGIYVGNNKVAENSSAHGTVDARGYRTLNRFGAVNVIVRLPDVVAKPATLPESTTKHDPPILVINDKPVEGAYHAGGHWFALDGRLAEILGYSTLTPSLNVPVQLAAFQHDFVIEQITGRLQDRGRVDMRIERAG